MCVGTIVYCLIKISFIQDETLCFCVCSGRMMFSGQKTRQRQKRRKKKLIKLITMDEFDGSLSITDDVKSSFLSSDETESRQQKLYFMLIFPFFFVGRKISGRIYPILREKSSSFCNSPTHTHTHVWKNDLLLHRKFSLSRMVLRFSH